jgi:hypothetical protein
MVFFRYVTLALRRDISIRQRHHLALFETISGEMVMGMAALLALSCENNETQRALDGGCVLEGVNRWCKTEC